jgi:hypothetical protein
MQTAQIDVARPGILNQSYSRQLDTCRCTSRFAVV